MLNKIWYIQVDGQKEGPYSVGELKQDPRVTPDTLVWKQGFEEWIAARFVPELKVLFEDEEKPVELADRFKGEKVTQEDSILAIENSNFPFLIFWLIILLIVFAYFFVRFNGN